MTERQRRNPSRGQAGPALVGLAAGLGLGVAATALVAKWMVNRRVAALAPPLRWAVKKLAKSLR